MTVLKQGFIALKAELILAEKEDVVSDGFKTIYASNQVLCNIWSYDFYM